MNLKTAIHHRDTEAQRSKTEAGRELFLPKCSSLCLCASVVRPSFTK